MIAVKKTRLAAADRDHDLETITILQHAGVQSAARHDLAVAFDGDALACEVKRADQFDAGQGTIERAWFPVDVQCNHGVRKRCCARKVPLLPLESYFTVRRVFFNLCFPASAGRIMDFQPL